MFWYEERYSECSINPTVKGLLMSILESINGILECSKDIQHVIKTLQEALEDGKVTPSEFMDILQAVIAAVSNITTHALDIKTKVG